MQRGTQTTCTHDSLDACQYASQTRHGKQSLNTVGILLATCSYNGETTSWICCQQGSYKQAIYLLGGQLEQLQHTRSSTKQQQNVDGLWHISSNPGGMQIHKEGPTNPEHLCNNVPSHNRTSTAACSSKLSALSTIPLLATLC